MYIKEPTYKGSWHTYLEVCFDSGIWVSLLSVALIVSFSGCILFVNEVAKFNSSKYIYNFEAGAYG